MLASVLLYAAIVGDPISLVQLRYPANRITITTSSGTQVMYVLAANTPPELRRAYKVLEVAEREVLITEALQMLRFELVANERKLESLRTARLASYLTNSFSSQPLRFFDTALVAPPESRLKFRLSESLAGDAKVERAYLALDRLLDAHYQLQQALYYLAYPDNRPVAAAKPPVAKPPTAFPVIQRAAAPALRPGALVDAERAEKTAADAELAAEERERDARQNERTADAQYRDAVSEDRIAARAEWLRARDAWEQARRDWDAARAKWQAARDQLDTLRRARRAP
jgi:hypothetical protein